MASWQRANQVWLVLRNVEWFFDHHQLWLIMMMQPILVIAMVLAELLVNVLVWTFDWCGFVGMSIIADKISLGTEYGWSVMSFSCCWFCSYRVLGCGF